MNEIFGGGASSKLFMNVREKMSLCYSCSSTLEMDRGIIHVSSGIDPQNREIAQKAILEEFENIKEGKISEYEFSSAKKALENSYREIYDNPFDIFAFYSSRDSLGIECSIDECREKISAVTLRDVIKVANNTVLDSVYFLNGTAAVEGGEDGEDE
jgi:predicted Zn-dependent peptidase